MTTDMKVGQYSVYVNSPYPANFAKLYKGVTVVVDNHGNTDPKYVYLAIRTKKTMTCIWKRACERMDKLIFDDTSCSIECQFDKDPRNRCLHTLTFEPEVYEELKANIPDFIQEQNCTFTTEHTDTQTILVF